MHIRQQGNSVAHWHGHIVILGHRMGRLGEIAIFPARGLRTVESALTGLYSGRLNISHGVTPALGKPICLQSLPL
jgi:hypothetical protein